MALKHAFPALLLAAAVSAQAEDQVLNLYSWADYVAPQTLQRFLKAQLPKKSKLSA